MTERKNNEYRRMEFTSMSRVNEFYIFTDLRDLAEKCQLYQDEMNRCRTIGILQSINGRFYLSDLCSPTSLTECPVQVSMVYLKSPIQSTVIPYPVQVFGMLQWRNRPVIFARILQVLQVRTAIMLRNAMIEVSRLHLAVQDDCTVDEIT